MKGHYNPQSNKWEVPTSKKPRKKMDVSHTGDDELKEEQEQIDLNRPFSELLEAYPDRHTEIANKLIDAGAGMLVAKHLDRFKDLNHKDIANRLIAAGDVWMIAKHLENFKGLDHVEIANKLIAAGADETLAKHLGKFEGLDVSVANKLIDVGQGESVLEHIERFIDVDHNKIAQKCIDTNRFWILEDHIRYYKPGLTGLSDAIARAFIKRKSGAVVVHNSDRFAELQTKTVEQLVESAIAHRDAVGALAMAEQYQLPFVSQLQRAVRTFGPHMDTQMWEQFLALLDGKEQPEFAAFGVKHAGDAGALELERGLRAFRHEALFQVTDDPELLELLKEQPVAASVMKAITRFNESVHGEKTDKEWNRLLLAHIDALESDEAAQLNTAFTPSEPLAIRTLEEASESFSYSKGFLDRYQALTDDITAAQELVNRAPEGGFANELISSIQTSLQEELAYVQERKSYYASVQEDPERAEHPRDTRAAPFALKNLEKKQAAIQHILEDHVSMQPQELVASLMEIGGVEEELRRAVFALSLYVNEAFLETSFQQHQKEPSDTEMGQVIEFVDHVTNQETFAQFFENKKQRKALDSLLHIGAIEKELAEYREQRGVSNNTTSMAFIPSRDIKTELSGHMADACWASEYDSILKAFPNITSLTMVEHPGHEVHERVAGAALLIETTAKDGRELLVIRGLNPIENVANAVDVEDFFAQLVDYLEPIAQQMGRKLAVVIDDHRGGSASNRQAVFDFLWNRRSELERITLADDPKATFNGYTISRDTYLVS